MIVDNFGGNAAVTLSSGHVLIGSYDQLALPSGNQSGLFAVAELDASGAVVASKAFGSSVYTFGQELVGSPWPRPTRRGTIDLGGGVRTSTNGGTDPSKLFVLFGPGLSHQFSRSIDEPKSDSGNTDDSNPYAVVAPNAVIYAGQFWRSVDFGTGAMQAVGTGDSDFDIFVASYGFDGTPLVSRRFGGPGPDTVDATVSDASGAVYLAGGFTTSVDFGDGQHDGPMPDSGSPPAESYLVKLRP